MSRLVAIYDGGQAAAKGMPEDVKVKIEELLGAMKELRAAARNDDNTDLSIIKLVLLAEQDVNRLVESWNGAAPVDAIEDADFS